MSERIGSLLLKGLLALLLVGLILGLVIPLLQRNGITTPQWVIWPLIVAALAIVIGPAVWAAARRAR